MFDSAQVRVSSPVKMAATSGTLLILAAISALCYASVINVPAPTIISRADWGARPAQGPVENLTENPPPFVVIHHSATPGCTTQALCQAKVRSIQNYHINNRHWSDIGYNFLVGEDGNVYEGRGWGKRGAHSVKYNAKSIGICLLGNFTNRVPNAAAITAATSLITWGAANGKIKDTYSLVGHRQTAATNCPGDELYQKIQTWPHWADISN